MSKRIFTQEQTSSLLKNKNVVRASEKSISYRNDFKLTAVRRYHEGLLPSVIFQEAGFDLAIIGRKTPRWLVKDWRKVFNKKGAVGLREDNRGRHSRGRPPDLGHMNDKEKLKYLEARVAYLKAENDFLAKLRKQRLNYDRLRNSESSGH